MSDIDLKTKNVVQLFIVNPKEFSKLNSLDFEFLKDLILKINSESEEKESKLDQINTISISIELIKIIVLNNLPCNFNSLFELLIAKAFNLSATKSIRSNVISLMIKLIEDESVSNEKYVENNRNIIKKMNIPMDETIEIDIKELIKTFRDSLLNKEISLQANSGYVTKFATSSVTVSSTMIQEGLLNFQNKAYNSILKMSRSDSSSKSNSKSPNGLFTKMILKLFKESNGGKIIMKSLENDYKLPLIISEKTEYNHLLEIIANIQLEEESVDNFEKVESMHSEMQDMLQMVQLMKYLSVDVDNLESLMSIYTSVVTASYICLLAALLNKKSADSDDTAINSSLEFINKFIPEACAMFENLHLNKPLLVFGAVNVLAFHKFIKQAEKHCADSDYQQLLHGNQELVVLARIVLHKLNNLITNAGKESELNWTGDVPIGKKTTFLELLDSSSRNWLCVMLDDMSMNCMLFWLDNMGHNAGQIMTYITEQNSLSSISQQAVTGQDNILFVDDDDGPGEEYGLNHLFTDYQEKVHPSISNTSSLVRYESRNDSQKLSVQFVGDILRTLSSLVMLDDKKIHALVHNQFDKSVLHSLFRMCSLLDQDVVNIRETYSNNDLNELTKLFVNFVNLLFSFDVITRQRSIDILSMISIQLPTDITINDCELPMNLELGPMILLVMLNISIQYTHPLPNQICPLTSWLKSDIFIKLMWKNMLHSIRYNVLNVNSKCIDVCQEFIQLFLLIFHGLTSISAKSEIVSDILTCLTTCSASKYSCQPRLIGRLLIILNYLMHQFYEQSPNLTYQLQYNLLTKYISDPISSDVCNYQYEEVLLLDNKSNAIFYDVSVPWAAAKKFWPGSNPDSLILKHLSNNPRYESFFNGVLDAIQICLDHRQIFDETQKNPLLSFTSSFYSLISCWRLLEIMPLPENYHNEMPTTMLDNTVKLIYNHLKLRRDTKTSLASQKTDFSEDAMLIEYKNDSILDVDQYLNLVVALCNEASSKLRDNVRQESLAQQIFQIDMMIVSINFVLHCLKDDMDNSKEADKSSVLTKCYLDMNKHEHSKLSTEIMATLLRIYEALICQLESYLINNKEIGFASLDLSLLAKTNIESKLESINFTSLKYLSGEVDKLVQKWPSSDTSSELSSSNEISFTQMKLFLTSRTFDTKFCIEHDNIIDMIRAETHRRFVFIVDHYRSACQQITRSHDNTKLILSSTMIAIKDLRETFALLDNQAVLTDTSIVPSESHSTYLNLVVLNSINSFIPVDNVPIKALKSIPTSVYNEVIARKLMIFCNLNKTTATTGTTPIPSNLAPEIKKQHNEVTRQSINCLTSMIDHTRDVQCLDKIVSVLLEHSHNDSRFSNVDMIFLTIFDVDNNVSIPVKCSLLRLVNLVLYRYNHSRNDKDIHEVLSRLHHSIHNVTSGSVGSDMISKIDNWINDILMDANLPDDNGKSDYLANVLLFSELLAVTSCDADGEMNLCNAISKSILHMDEKVRLWLVKYRNMLTPVCEFMDKPALINLHIIIEMVCVISNGNCPLSVYVNVIQTLLDWNKDINKSLSKHAEYKQPYGPHMELMCASVTRIYNHIGAVICALNTMYQTENTKKKNQFDLSDTINPSSQLYLNDFNMKQLSIDKKAIEDILFCQVKYSQNSYDADSIMNSESEEEKSIKSNPLDDQLCTFAATHKEFTDQHWYHCHTCAMVENEGVCTICAKVCHFGHDLTYAKRGSFFCDCGAKGSPFCEALTRRTNRTGSSKKTQSLAGQSAPVDVIKKEKTISKNQTAEKSKYNLLSSMSKFSKFSSTEKLLRKNFKTDTKNRLSTNKTNSPAEPSPNTEATNDDSQASALSTIASTTFNDNQIAYRLWITNVLRDRVLKENETLTILLETSTLLDDCFSALQTIHEIFKVLYADWAVGKNTQMKEAFKCVRTNEKIIERSSTIMGSSLQLRNTEPPSDMSGIPPTSVLATDIAGTNSHVRGMLQSGYVRRNVLAVVSPRKGVVGDQYFLAVAQDKSRIVIYKISSLLEELNEATTSANYHGANVEEKSIELESKQGMIEQVCTATLPFTVLSMRANPVNQQYMAVCGLKEVSVLIFTSMGSVSSKTIVQPIFEDSNQFIIYSMWLPGSLTYLVLVLTQSVQIFDLSQTTNQPVYHFKSVESRFKDATFAFIRAKNCDSTTVENTKIECYVLVMSESGCIHCKKLDKNCMASSGFYLAEMLDWNPELYNMNRDLKTGVLGKGGASIHYDHNLQLLFHSYNNGRTFCSVLDSGQDDIYVDKNYCLDIKNDTDYDCTLVNWFSINDHPGLLTAICQQTNAPVYLTVEPDKYCYQIHEKCDITETAHLTTESAADISVASLSKVTDAITFPWQTVLEDKKKLRRTLSMVLFNDGRIKILMANVKSQKTDGRFWLQERFVNTFLNDCLQGVAETHASRTVILDSFSSNENKNYGKLSVNKDKIFLENPSCGRIPVDFFEHCESTNEVSFGGDRFLELYSQDVLNLRMLSPDHSVTVACKNPVTVVITNKKPESLLVGVRVGINVTDPTKIPKYFEIYGRKIPIPDHVTKNRLVDIGLYRSEILQNEKSLNLIIGPSKNANDIIVFDYIKVFTRLKSTLPWLNEKQAFIRSKDMFTAKNQTKSVPISSLSIINRSIKKIVANHNMQLSTTNPYLPKPELLSSGLQLLTAFFHFKNMLNLESRPTFSSSELVTSTAIRTFTNDILSAFYPPTVSMNATTLLACVDSIKQIDGDMEPRFKKCLISNIGQKLFASCSKLIVQLKDNEPDPTNVLMVEATIIRLAHLINVHKSWISIDEDKFSSLSYMDVFEIMTNCIELIIEYHAVCSCVRPVIGTESDINILSNFVNPVYSQKLDYLPSLIPVIIKGLLCFNFVTTDDTSSSVESVSSTIGSVQFRLTDLLIKMLIDPNLSISHNTRRSLNYFMKMCDKKTVGEFVDKKSDETEEVTTKNNQTKLDPSEGTNEHAQKRNQSTTEDGCVDLDVAPLDAEGAQALSILLPDSAEGPSNDNEPEEEEIDDREYFCRVDDEWMIAVSNSESNSLGGSTLANDTIHFFQQMDAETAPTMAEVMQEMIDNADDQRMLDYALRKSLEDQGGASSDGAVLNEVANEDEVVTSSTGSDDNSRSACLIEPIEQVIQEATVVMATDPACSMNTDEEQQSLNNNGPPVVDSWIINKAPKKVTKQVETLSTPDRECSESNSESDITTFGMLKSALDTSKLTSDHTQKDFVMCIQRFGIQFMRRLICQWTDLMSTVTGTRAISLFKSVLDVIRYMDLRDDEAKSGVQKLVALMLDLVQDCAASDDNNISVIEYDTADKRLHCQLVCVVLRTLLNLIMSGTIPTVGVSASSKDDNNSTAVHSSSDSKCTGAAGPTQLLTQDSVAYITLKMMHDRRLVAFCLVNLDKLLAVWRNQSVELKNTEKDSDAIAKLLRHSIAPQSNVELPQGYDWLPMSDVDSVCDLHLLMTEILLRLPYAVLKLCRNTMKEIRTTVADRTTSDDREFMTDLSNSIQKESKWHSVLCEFIEVNINDNITKASRTLLNSVVGAKHYRTIRDIHLIGGSINKIKLLLEKYNVDQNSIIRIKLPFDDTLKLLELVDSCINKAKERPSNWKVYCTKCPEILSFMMLHSVSLHHTIGMKLLYLLQLALLDSDSSKIKKDAQSTTATTGISTTTAPSTTPKVDDKPSQKKPAMAVPQINKQEAKLCRALTNKFDNNVLVEFVKVYLCEHEESGVRWLAEAVLANLYNHGKSGFRSLLLDTLADCWAMSFISPQLADLIGHLLAKHPNWERLETFSIQLTNSISQSSRELLANPNTPFYNCLQRLARLPGYYLDADPCPACLPSFTVSEMHLYRWDSEPTDNRRNQAKAATITGMGLHTASSSINNNDYLAPNVRSNPTVHVFNLRAPFSIQSLTVKFSGTRRQRPQCGITLYYSDISTVSTTQMLDQTNLWQKVKTVTVSKDMAEMKLDFPVLLTAVYLIFEYDCFSGSVASSDAVKCPRCHSASIQGNVCLNCRDNINQCFRCRAINYAGIDSFICANCSSCRYGRIDFTMMAKPCYDFIEELKSEESREVMINRITTWSETVEKNSQEMIVLKQELDTLLDQVKMMDAAEMTIQRKMTAPSVITGVTSGIGAAKLAVTAGKTYAEVTGSTVMDDSGLQARSYRRIRRPAGAENEPEKEVVKPTTVVAGGTAPEVSKEEKKDFNQSKDVHEALNQLVTRYSTDAKEQQFEISYLWRQLWAAKKAVADYDTRLARARNHSDYVHEDSESGDVIKQHCYTCLLSKFQLQIWLMKGLCFIPEVRNTMTSSAIAHNMQTLLLGQMLDALPSWMRQEIVVLTVQITRDRADEVTKLNKIIMTELIYALRTPYLSASRETRIKIMIALLRSSVACPDSLWELRLRPAIAVLLEASSNGALSDNCTKIVVAPCIALIQACMRFLVGRVKPVTAAKKQASVCDSEQTTDSKPLLNFSLLPVLNINQWLHDDNFQLFDTWSRCTKTEVQSCKDISKSSQEPRINHLTQKYGVKWLNYIQKNKLSKSSGLKLVNVENVSVSQAWLWQALLSPANQFCRQATHLLMEMLAYQSVERHRIVLSVLVQCLPHMVSGVGADATDLVELCSPLGQAISSMILPEFQLTSNDASAQYVALLKRLSQEKHWRCYLVVKCKLIAIIDLAMSRVLKFLSQTEETCLDSWRHGQTRPGLAQGGWAAINLLKSLAELLLHLQEMPAIAYKYRATIVRCLLTSSLNLRRLIVFRSKMTTDMETRFNKTVDDLSKDSEEIIRSFIKIAVSVLKQFPVTDLQSAGHIIEKINAYVCPRDYEHPVFDVVLDIFKGQEDFLPHRMIGVSLSSQSFGHNPTVNDVINFLVRENGVTSDIRLDLICDKKVLMYDLLLEDIYEHVWLCSDANNKNRPMRLTVRISGLVEDNMPYVENLRKDVPIEHYQRSNELIAGGLHTIIERLAAVDELAHGFSVIASSVRLLHYFIKVPGNDVRLIEPGIDTVKVLLQCLLVCLRGGLDDKRMTEYEEATVIPLIELLCRILVLGRRTGSTQQQHHMQQQADSVHAIPVLLDYISDNSRLELYQKHVTKVPALLAFEYRDSMSVIIDYVVPYFKQLIPDAQIDEQQRQIFMCCCNLMSSIPSDQFGTLLRHHMLEAGLLRICTDFLVAVAPEDALKDGTKLDLKRHDTVAFLEQPALQLVLVLGQACVGSSGFVEAGQLLLAIPGLLGFLHNLETVKSVQAIGVLSEDWLNALKECSADMDAVISGLRNSTQKNLRAQALKVRQKQLNDMRMTVNDKGQVLTSSSLLKDLSSQVLEEPGHCCDICLDGYVNKPQESLGVYTFVKKVLVHDLMSGRMTALPGSVPCANQYYYTSVSNYVCVHFSCHNQAVKVVNENEWVVAQRHNQNAKCNSLMPILGPHHDNNFKTNLNRYQTSIWNNTNVPEINYQLMVHDLKFLLLRFAHNRQFNEDTGGGARLSNIRLVPQIVQIAIANLLSQIDLISKETQAITKWLEQAGTPSKLFNQNTWQATNTPYRTVQFILFHSRDMWMQHRLHILKLLVQFAHVRHLNVADLTLLQASQLEPLSYSVYQPFLVLFGLLQSIYNILFKNVTCSASGKSWMDALSLFIRENDVCLLDYSNKLIPFYEDNLLTCESLQELWDVAELGDSIPYEENYLATVLMELKDAKP